MRVRNVHERAFGATPGEVGALIDSLASRRDRLWPRRAWPPMRFDRPLAVGAHGGHGPIRYDIEAYQPGRSIRFRFTAPRGFDGWHRFEVVEGAPVVLRHILEMDTRGWARLTWPLLFRPLHDALIEDSLTIAQISLGEVPGPEGWSRRVRLLRWILYLGKAPLQDYANQA